MTARPWGESQQLRANKTGSGASVRYIHITGLWNGNQAWEADTRLWQGGRVEWGACAPCVTAPLDSTRRRTASGGDRWAELAGLPHTAWLCVPRAPWGREMPCGAALAEWRGPQAWQLLLPLLG